MNELIKHHHTTPSSLSLSLLLRPPALPPCPPHRATTTSTHHHHHRPPRRPLFPTRPRVYLPRRCFHHPSPPYHMCAPALFARPNYSALNHIAPVASLSVVSLTYAHVHRCHVFPRAAPPAVLARAFFFSLDHPPTTSLSMSRISPCVWWVFCWAGGAVVGGGWWSGGGGGERWRRPRLSALSLFLSLSRALSLSLSRTTIVPTHASRPSINMCPTA